MSHRWPGPQCGYWWGQRAVKPTLGETSGQRGLEKQEGLSHVQTLMYWKETDVAESSL